MVSPPPPQGPGINQFSTNELKQYLLTKQGKGPLYAFLFSSAVFFLIFLVTVLKPHRLYKRFIVFIFGIRVSIGQYKYKLHHFLLVLIAFYGSLYFFLQMQGRQTYPSKMDSYRMKMEKLDKKWIVDAQSWLAFLNIICLLGIYKNAKLFNSENYFQKKIAEYDNELKLKKN